MMEFIFIKKSKPIKFLVLSLLKELVLELKLLGIGDGTNGSKIK